MPLWGSNVDIGCVLNGRHVDFSQWRREFLGVRFLVELNNGLGVCACGCSMVTVESVWIRDAYGCLVKNWSGWDAGARFELTRTSAIPSCQRGAMHLDGSWIRSVEGVCVETGRQIRRVDASCGGATMCVDVLAKK